MASILPALSLHTQAAIFICVVVLLGIYHRKKDRHRRLPYPPGPKPLPLLGNLFHIPTTNVAAEYQKLATQYGSLVFLSVLGKHILLVSSFQHAKALFGKHSSNFSDRPTSVMSTELMGWDFSFGHMRYGDRWTKHRTMFQGEFNQSMSHLHWSVQTKEVHALLRGLLHSPEQLISHLSLNAAAIIMGVTYGIPINSTDDRYIAIAEKALDGMSEAANPGRFWVDLLPALKYVPEWMPGAGFQRKAREWRDAVTEMREAPFATVVNAMETGRAVPSFASRELSKMESTSGDSDEDKLETIKNCAGLAYAAGAESIASTLATFVLAMLTHPKVQERAYKEIASVIKSDRLPQLDDRPSLPYINAILKEVLRWNLVAPLGLPHMATHDQEYEGFFIPAGTIIVGNSRGILHNPDKYQNPDCFDPDRYEKKDENSHLSSSDPLSIAFGYGRRVCPGRYMAEAQVWISIACIINAFEIAPAVGADGSPIEVIPKFTSDMISHPLPFDFCIKPRSEAAKYLIEQTELEV